MKSKVKILSVAIVALLLGGCSTSMQFSKASKHQGDDVYYNPSGNYADEVLKTEAPQKTNVKGFDLAELEKRYTEILSNDTTGTVDTLIYKAEDSQNPYDRLLCQSYQDSYQRRLDASGSGYRSYSDYYDDLWYASAYDPYFYNIVVYGGHVWVEPYYVSAMFSWPYRYRRYGYWGYSPWSFSFGWGYGYPYYSYWGYPYNYWGYNWYSGWYGLNNYAWGYNNGYWDGYYWGNQSYGPNYHYGRRPVSGNTAYETTPVGGSNEVNINSLQDHLSTKQPTLYATGGNTGGNDFVTSPQEPIRKPVGQTITRNPSTARQINDQNQVQVREPVRDPSIITRPSRESLNVNPTRVKPTGGEGQSTSSGSYNPSYTRPRPGNSNEFNRPNRAYPSTEAVRGNREGQQSTSPGRQSNAPSTRTYNPPSRVNTPTSGANNRSDSGRSNVSAPSSGSRSTSSPSTSGSSSSSGSSSRSSSGSSSSSSSGSSGTKNR